MWKKYLLYFIIHFYRVCGTDENYLLVPNNDEQESNRFENITECIVTSTICDMTYLRRTVVILKRKTKEDTENYFINELVKTLMQENIPQVILKDVIEDENKDIYVNSMTVAFFDSCADVIEFTFKGFEYIKYLIIIFDPETDCHEKLNQIQQPVGMYDVTFIVKDFKGDRNKIYTIFPEKDKITCTVITNQTTHINTCFNGTIQKKIIFPIKNPNNLNNCPLKVGMASLFPFSTIKNKEILKTYDPVTEIKGSDLEIMKIVTKYINATLDMYYINRKEENPYGDTEFLNFVLNKSFDACGGGLYRIYGNIVEYSGPYNSQDVLWIYYAERAERSWENLIRKLYGLYIFVIFYICYSFVWYLICLFDGDAVSFKNTLLYGWGALVGATSLQDPRSKKQKIMNLMYLMMCIYLSTFVSIKFYSFLTIRAPPQLFKTNDDIMISGRKPYLKASTKYFNNDEKYVKFANTSGDCVSFLDCAIKTLNYNGLTVILQANFFKFQAETAVNDEARILRASENVITVYNEMIIRKKSPYVVKFQKIISRLFEGGITRKLFFEAIGLSVVAKAESANMNMITNSYSCQAGCMITFKQFAGVFYAWIIGCVLSCFIFTIELFKRLEIIQTSYAYYCVVDLRNHSHNSIKF